METSVKVGESIFAVIGGALVWFFGPWDALIMVLIAFVVADYAMGVVNAVVHGKLSSQTGWKGLLKKIAIFVLVGVAALLDRAVPAANGALRSAVCFFYIANEGLSILENIGAMGVPLPGALKKVLTQLDEKSKDGEDISE